MTEEIALKSLEEMAQESFTNRPNQAPEAIEEYLSNIEQSSVETANALKLKLNNPEYNEKFKYAITYTSLMVFVAVAKVTQPLQLNPSFKLKEVNYDKYIREFLFFAKNDDRSIYDMRLFYLKGLDSSSMGIEVPSEELEDLPEEQVSQLKKIVKQAQSNYDELIGNLTTQYVNSKAYLVQE